MNRTERLAARRAGTHAALLALNHADRIHYTQGPGRWQGIAERFSAAGDEYPTVADCSSFASWVLYNALDGFKTPDTVNGTDWHSGWTGTLCQHGEVIHHSRTKLRCDLAFYGTGAPWEHVAVIVGHRDGKPLVVSHGSEAGPLLLPIDYRSDLGEVRRYILGSV